MPSRPSPELVFLFAVVVTGLLISFAVPGFVPVQPAGEFSAPAQRLTWSPALSLAAQQANGYLIQLQDPPVFSAGEPEEDAAIAGSFTAVTRQAAAKTKKQQLDTKRKSALQKTLSKLKQSKAKTRSITGRLVGDESAEPEILGEYAYTFNGFALNISAAEADELKSLPEVKAVYPNLKVEATLMDSVPLIGADKVWQLDKEGNNCAESGKECLTGKGVTIGIIDTGVDYTHPDLGGCLGKNCKVIGGYDFVNGDNKPMDDQGHGTHVAATAAGNGKLKGVAPDANIYAYKVLDAEGSGYWDDILSAIEMSADPNQDGDLSDKLDVISLSLGADCDGIYDEYCGPDDIISTAIDNIAEAGVVAVIAAGNSGPYEETIGTPGTSRKAITVGATFKKDYDGEYWDIENPKVDAVTSFSSRGPVIANDKSFALIKPDVVAPGAIICAAQSSQDTIWQWVKDEYDIDLHCLDNKHIAISGTSMATPHVSGVAALLKQKNPGWLADDIKTALRSTTVSLFLRDEVDDEELYDGPGLRYPVSEQGYGRVDAMAAVQGRLRSRVHLDTSGAVKGSVDIRGTAAGKNFVNYTLLIGDGVDPITWATLSSSTLPVNNGILFASLSTIDYNDGIYMLRLVVANANGETSEDRSLIIIDNFELVISNPLDGDVYRPGEVLEITGLARGPNLNLFLTYEFMDGNELKASTDGIDLVPSEGDNINGLLARWNTSRLLFPGEYTLTGHLKSGDREVDVSEIAVAFDSTLREGWPQRISGYYNDFLDEESITKSLNKKYLFSGMLNKGIAEELLHLTPKTFYKKTFDPQFRKFVSAITQKYRSILRGLKEQKRVTAAMRGVYTFMGLSSPIVSDIDGDGKKEILVSVDMPPRMFVFSLTGDVLPGWPVFMGEYQYVVPSPAVADINGDGRKEIIIDVQEDIIDVQENFVSSLYLSIYNSQGRMLRSILLSNADYINFKSETVVSDLNRDGVPEILKIVVDEFDSEYSTAPDVEKVIITSVTGNPLPGWPKVVFDIDAAWKEAAKTGELYYAPSYNTPAPVPLDIDGDGIKEIGIVSSRAVPNYPPFSGDNMEGDWHIEAKVSVFYLNGTLVPGFPLNLDGFIHLSPVAGDLDGDGFDELVVGTTRPLSYEWYIQKDFSRSGLYVIDRFGKIKSGWPKLAGGVLMNNIILANVTNDHEIEIMIIAADRATDHEDGYIFDHEGSTLLKLSSSSAAWVSLFYNLISGGMGYPLFFFGAEDSYYNENYYPGGLFAVTPDGTISEGFPKNLEFGYTSTPALADIDNDGDGELVILTDDWQYSSFEPKQRASIYVWDVPGKFDEKLLSWPQFMRDAQHSNYYPTKPLCIDTDGGNNLFVKGTATRTTPQDEITHTGTDECTSKTDIVEHYCFQTSMVTHTQQCPTSCSAGRCDNRLYDGSFENLNFDRVGNLDKAHMIGQWGLKDVMLDALQKEKVLYIKPGAAGSGGGTQTIAALPAKTYTLTASAKPAGISTILKLQFLDNNKKILQEKKVSSFPDKKWSTKTITATSPSKTAFAKILLIGTNTARTAGSVYWDDIKVTVKE